MATCSSKASVCEATGRKSKIPPPALSTSTTVSASPRRVALQQRAEVVRERDVAEVHDDARAGGRGAEGRGERAVDAVGAAVGEHPRRRVAHRPEGLDVADRHRGGGEDGDLARQRRQRARHGRLAQRVAERRGDALRGGGVGCAPRVSHALGRDGPAIERAHAAGSASRTSATTPAGSCQAASGSKAIWRRRRRPRATGAGAWRWAGRRCG